MPKIPATTRRIVIESVRPLVDGGRFPAKRIVDREIEVGGDIFANGHDKVSAVLKHRFTGETEWTEEPMEPLGNDAWRAAFTPDRIGDWEFELEGWVDHFATWAEGTRKKIEASVDVSAEILMAAKMAGEAASRADGKHGAELKRIATRLGSGKVPLDDRIRLALSPELTDMMQAHADRSTSTVFRAEITVDRPRAGFSTWYELVPRSWSSTPGARGTFADVEKHLDYVSSLGFDVLYLPPIHPIGTTFRKGPNNTLSAGGDDPGVPWAIGSAEGGHKAINPDLGDIEDFRSLRDAAAERGIELALDIAFQCSPDHPWVKEHPEWFQHRPDGSIQYAENPPKKYQDIYPLDFETSDTEALWAELKSVFDHWIDQGVRIFRVDNPHTKTFAFWEWVIRAVRSHHPDVIFLAEAFTRPKVMHRLAKLGFTQSYTYYTWRTTRHDLETYMGDLEQVSDFFRPNFWPNTPDILTEQLQTGGRAAFVARYLIAATLSSNCGIYGPAYELLEHEPLRPGSEEYLDSEKYQIREWDLDSERSIAPFIAQMNRVRQHHPALHETHNLTFHGSDNEMIMAYSKRTGGDVVLVVVSLDPHNIQSGWIHLDLPALGLETSGEFTVFDLLTERRYRWSGPDNFVQLDPASIPGHVFSINHPAP